MTTARWRGAAASGACAAVAVVLHGLRGDLPAPPVHSWSDTVGWYEATGAPSAAAAALRLVAMAIAAWLSVAIGLQVLASLRPLRFLRHVADAVSPTWPQRLWRGMAGLSLSAGLALPAAAVIAPSGAAAPAQVEPSVVGDPPPSAGSTSDGVAVMRPLPAPASDATTTTAPPPSPPGPTSDVAPSPAEPSVAPPEAHTVVVGESCWSIAADLLRDAHRQEPDDRLVWTVWTRLIELNRDRFVTGDPDVIFPGQRLLLPDLG